MFVLAFWCQVLERVPLPRYVEANLWELWVGGEPRKTAGPTLRGAVRCRTLQEGPNVCCGLAVNLVKPRVPNCEERPGAAHSRRDQMCISGWRCAQENRGSHTARSGQVPHTPGGTKCVLRVGGDPRKTAGPTLREAARCRTLQEGPKCVLGLAVSPGKPPLSPVPCHSSPTTRGLRVFGACELVDSRHAKLIATRN